MSEGTNPIVEFFRGSIGNKLEGAPPLTAWLDGRIVSCDPGKMEVRFVSRPEMANPTGLLHGGMQAAIMDDVIGMIAATLGEGGFMLSIDIHVNDLGKLPIGRPVTARARFVRLGKRIAHAVCELVDDEGNVVSRCDSNLLKTGFEPEYQKKIARQEN